MNNAKSVYISFVAIFLIFSLKYSVGAELKNSDLQVIASVEAELVLPPGSQKLQNYTRYYQIFGRDTHSKIRGLYVSDGTLGRVHIVRESEMPKILDGGCGVIDVVFTRSGKIISVQCHGKA